MKISYYRSESEIINGLMVIYENCLLCRKLLMMVDHAILKTKTHYWMEHVFGLVSCQC